MSALSDKEFRQFQTWLYDRAGIHLGDAKKALVAARLVNRLRDLNLPDYGAYFRMITAVEGAGEAQIALDLLTTNETYFYREPKHFEFLREQLLARPRAARPSAARPIRVWSAACSSGEEPYSLAMTLAEVLDGNPWEVVASDISTRMLEKAARGHYPMERGRNLPRELLERYCLKGIGNQAGTFLVERNLRERVKFVQVNLNSALPRMGEFDVIFLRNVLIYFDMATKRKVVDRLVPQLRRGGHFIISHSESLNGVNDTLELLSPSMYRKP
ncbi:CheR family methyltransferase [Pseudomonas entomophila]|uniref:CheR family methyltransferase n=1 Tax=Pseudomonas sp. RIT-PI-S TaxID=3035295 RepID=UPI0021D7D690